MRKIKEKEIIKTAKKPNGSYLRETSGILRDVLNISKIPNDQVMGEVLRSYLNTKVKFIKNDD